MPGRALGWFLRRGEGGFVLDSYQDGVNADRWGSDYKRVKGDATKATRLKVKLAEGGGWAARLSPAN